MIYHKVDEHPYDEVKSHQSDSQAEYADHVQESHENNFIKESNSTYMFRTPQYQMKY